MSDFPNDVNIPEYTPHSTYVYGDYVQVLLPNEIDPESEDVSESYYLCRCINENGIQDAPEQFNDADWQNFGLVMGGTGYAHIDDTRVEFWDDSYMHTEGGTFTGEVNYNIPNKTIRARKPFQFKKGSNDNNGDLFALQGGQGTTVINSGDLTTNESSINSILDTVSSTKHVSGSTNVDNNGNIVSTEQSNDLIFASKRETVFVGKQGNELVEKVRIPQDKHYVFEIPDIDTESDEDYRDIQALNKDGNRVGVIRFKNYNGTHGIEILPINSQNTNIGGVYTYVDTNESPEQLHVVRTAFPTNPVTNEIPTVGWIAGSSSNLVHINDINGTETITGQKIFNEVGIKYLRLLKTNNDMEGGQLDFQGANNDHVVNKNICIDRYDGKLRIVGPSSTDPSVTSEVTLLTANFLDKTLSFGGNISSNINIVKDIPKLIIRDLNPNAVSHTSGNNYDGNFIQFLDKNGAQSGYVYQCFRNDGGVHTYVRADKGSAYAIFDVYVTNDGAKRASIPTFSVKSESDASDSKEGGAIYFNSAQAEPNVNKTIMIDRYNGTLRLWGADSSNSGESQITCDFQNHALYLQAKQAVRYSAQSDNPHFYHRLSYVTRGTNPNADTYPSYYFTDKNYASLAGIQYSVKTTGANSLQIYLKDFVGNTSNTKSSITLGQNTDQSAYINYSAGTHSFSGTTYFNNQVYYNSSNAIYLRNSTNQYNGFLYKQGSGPLAIGLNNQNNTGWLGNYIQFTQDNKININAGNGIYINNRIYSAKTIEFNNISGGTVPDNMICGKSAQGLYLDLIGHYDTTNSKRVSTIRSENYSTYHRLTLGVNNFNNDAPTGIVINVDNNGNYSTTTITPASADNSTKIATTNWCNTKFIQVVPSLPSNPNANLWYAIPE